MIFFRIIYILIFSLIVFYILSNRRKDKKVLSIYFGVPGSGKSTFAAHLTRKCFKNKIPVYSNVPIIGAYQYDTNDLGKYLIEDCKLIIDEAGLEFNNREFKKFSRENLEFFKLHRHYGCSVDVFSQTYDDMDKKIRSLAYRLFVVRRSLIPLVVSVVPIRRSVGIDEQTHQICDFYKFDPLLIRLFTTKRIFIPKYWKYFDSYSAPALPAKKFITYTHK